MKQVWNRIKDEANKVGVTKNLLQYKKKIRKSKNPRKKSNR